MNRRLAAILVLSASLILPQRALAWGATGHRTIAAIAAQLLPPAKVARMNTLLGKLEIDKDFIDAASYPDEYLRSHKPSTKPWHFADLPDSGPFTCNGCLFDRLQQNLAVVRQGKGDKAEAVALAWVIHLVGDLHQPLHLAARDVGGNTFNVTYRGQTSCIGTSNVELHSVWDDCLVGEGAAGRTPTQYAGALAAGITTYKGRPELAPIGTSTTPWLSWGADSHALAVQVAFDHLNPGADLGDAYVLAPNNAKATAESQMLTAGIRLAALLDAAFQ